MTNNQNYGMAKTSGMVDNRIREIITTAAALMSTIAIIAGFGHYQITSAIAAHEREAYHKGVPVVIADLKQDIRDLSQRIAVLEKKQR